MWEMQVNKVLFDLLYEKKIQYNDIAMYGVAARRYALLLSLSHSAVHAFIFIVKCKQPFNAFWRKENKNCFRIFWNIQRN